MFIITIFNLNKRYIVIKEALQINSFSIKFNSYQVNKYAERIIECEELKHFDNARITYYKREIKIYKLRLLKSRFNYFFSSVNLISISLFIPLFWK